MSESEAVGLVWDVSTTIVGFLGVIAALLLGLALIGQVRR